MKKLIITLTIIFCVYNLDAQNTPLNYKGGQDRLISDVIDQIEVPRDLAKEKSSYFSQMFVYVSKGGVIDSIVNFHNHNSRFDEIAKSAINATKANWKKSKINTTIMLNIWFHSEDASDIVIKQEILSNNHSKRAYSEVIVLPNIVFDFYYSEGKKPMIN